MAVFDSIDTNGDGVLSKEEFSMAVEKMHYTDLLKIKDSLSRNELSFNPSADEEKSLEATNASILGRRSIVTAEVSKRGQSLCYHFSSNDVKWSAFSHAQVAISKIFPAGAC